MAKFNDIDKDGNGLITRQELWDFINASEEEEIKMTEQEFDALYMVVDRCVQAYH